MKISDALVEVRKLKEQVSRLYSIRNDSFKVIIPKGVSIEEARKEPSKYDINLFEDITDNRIEPIEKEILRLRWRIMKTNTITIVDVSSITDPLHRAVMEFGSSMSLAMLKLIIDQLKSRLAQLMSLKEHRSSYMTRRIMSADDEEKEVPQISELGIENVIRALENEKTKLQALLDKTNASTDLLE